MAKRLCNHPHCWLCGRNPLPFRCHMLQVPIFCFWRRLLSVAKRCESFFCFFVFCVFQVFQSRRQASRVCPVVAISSPKEKRPTTQTTRIHICYFITVALFFLVAFFLLKKVCCKNSLTCCPQGTTCSDYKAPGWPSWGVVTTCVPSNSNGDAGEQGSGASDNSPNHFVFRQLEEH